MLTEVRLRNGQLGLIWALLPEDREQLAREYERLSPESKHHRFLTGVPRLSGSMLDRLVDGVDGTNHIALVMVLIDDDGRGTPAGVGRFIRYPDDPSSADVAVTVTEDVRGRGVASALLAALVTQRPSGIERLRTTVSANNPAALAMLTRLGSTTVRNQGDRLDVDIDLGDARPRPDEQ